MKILSYFSMSSLVLFILPIYTFAQDMPQSDSISVTQQPNIKIEQIQKKELKENEEKWYTYKGLSLSTDIFGYLSSILSNSISGEVALEANLGNRFYPIVEIGYGSINHTDENYNIHYRSKAPYYRIGLNYNFSYRKDSPPRPSYIYGAVRFGFTKLKYDVSSPPLQDPVWGGEVPFDLTDINGFYSWIELGVGVKVKIWKRFHMGWCIRYKARANVINNSNSKVWYVPGFGNSRHTTFGATYSLIYDLPF